MATTNCPSVLANGTCPDPTCSYIHNITTCGPCNLVFSDNDAYALHLRDKRHLSRLSGSFVISHCHVCNANIPGGMNSWNCHVLAQRHVKNAYMKGISGETLPQPATTTSRAIVCDACQCLVQNHQWQSHIRNVRHISRETFARYKSALENAESDKHDIVVEGNFDLGIVDPAVAVAGKKIYATVNTSATHSKTVLVDLRLASAQDSRVTGASA